MSDTELFTPRELADISGWPERRIRKLLQKGALRHVRIGTGYYLPRNAIEEFIRENMVIPVQAGVLSSRSNGN